MYIELFILDNLLMNLIILRLAAALLSLRAGILSSLLFSLFGAVCSALGAGGITLLISPAAKLILTASMSLCMPVRGIRKRLLAFPAVFISAAIVGGAVMLFALVFGGSMRFGALYAGISIRAALIGGVFASFLPNIIRRLLSRRIEESATVCLRIVLKSGDVIECAALVDSGNLLSDPISALPVIVISAKKYAQAAAAASIPIPARTANGACTLNALKPRSILLDGTPVNALVAFSKASTALVPASLICPLKGYNKTNIRNGDYDETASIDHSKAL